MEEIKLGKYKIHQEEILVQLSKLSNQPQQQHRIERNLNQIPGLFGLEIDNERFLTFWNCWYNNNNQEEKEDIPFLLPQKNDLIFVCIMHGGYFSGAIFDPFTGKALVHKTFSNYVSRKKQGGRQLQHDVQTGHKAKSAGSEIRRSQEVKFQEKLHELVTETWKKYFDGTISQKVFAAMVYCPGNINREMIEQLIWNELEVPNLPIRNIPFQVPKPNFMNLLSCYEKMCTVHITSKDRINELTNEESTILSNLDVSDDENQSSDDDKTKEQILNDEYLKNYPSPLSPQSATFSSPLSPKSPLSPLSPILQALGFNIEPKPTQPKPNTNFSGQPLLSSKRKKKKQIPEPKLTNDDLIGQSLKIWGVIFAVAAVTLSFCVWKFSE